MQERLPLRVVCKSRDLPFIEAWLDPLAFISQKRGRPAEGGLFSSAFNSIVRGKFYWLSLVPCIIRDSELDSSYGGRRRGCHEASESRGNILSSASDSSLFPSTTFA